MLCLHPDEPEQTATPPARWLIKEPRIHEEMAAADIVLREFPTFTSHTQPQRAMEFVRLDTGSQFAARQTALILLGQGKVDEARQTIQRTSDTPQMGRHLLQVCLDPKQASQLDGAAQQVEAASIAEGDVEGWYIDGTMLSYCGRNDAALRLLKRAVAQNYCAYTALQTDPLLGKFRGTPEFSGLLSAAKECQSKFLAHRDQIPH